MGFYFPIKILSCVKSYDLSSDLMPAKKRVITVLEAYVYLGRGARIVALRKKIETCHLEESNYFQ